MWWLGARRRRVGRRVIVATWRQSSWSKVALGLKVPSWKILYSTLELHWHCAAGWEVWRARNCPKLIFSLWVSRYTRLRACKGTCSVLAHLHIYKNQLCYITNCHSGCLWIQMKALISPHSGRVGWPPLQTIPRTWWCSCALSPSWSPVADPRLTGRCFSLLQHSWLAAVQVAQESFTWPICNQVDVPVEEGT